MGSDARSLAGIRVLVTRAREQARGTVSLLEARGAEVAVVPTIEIHPPRDPGAVRRGLEALAKGGAYDWVAFTSENGVARTWVAMEEATLGAEIFRAVKIAAIGPGTAQALSERGAAADVVAKEARGEGLAKAMLEAMGSANRGARVLLLRAEVAREISPETLRAAGHSVDVVAVYETRKPAADVATHLARELARGAIDAVMLTSASTVDNLVDALRDVSGDGAATLLGKTVVASIGPITSAALARHGLAPAIEAPAPTLAGLVDALAEHFAQRNRARR